MIGAMGKFIIGLVLLVIGAMAAWNLITGGGGDSPDWSHYSPAVKARVEQAVAAHDCSALQSEFNSADSNNSVDLMKYLDNAMKDAGCY